MVRLSTDALRPPSARFNYPNALSGLVSIARTEGLASVFRGWGPTCARSVVMNASQLSCYDLIKAWLLSTGRWREGVPLHLVTATMGGTVAVTLCSPLDVLKSRVQNSRTGGVSLGGRSWWSLRSLRLWTSYTLPCASQVPPLVPVLPFPPLSSPLHSPAPLSTPPPPAPPPALSTPLLL